MCLFIDSVYHTLIRLAGVEVSSGLTGSIEESDNTVARGVLGAWSCGAFNLALCTWLIEVEDHL